MNKANPEPKKGQLIIVGTGIKAPSQCSLRAKYEMETADVVYHSIPDVIAREWVQSLNKNNRSMLDFYQHDRTRLETYRQMTRALIDAVEAGKRVCAVFYGHPGVFVSPSHAAMQYLKAKQYEVEMLPGISAEDCLFADLGVDPGHHGCQAIEATSFLLYQRTFDASVPLILWQIGALGDLAFVNTQVNSNALFALLEKLYANYPADHRVCVYESATWEIMDSRIDWVSLTELPMQTFSSVSTLFVPPARMAEENTLLLTRLGLETQKRYSRPELNALLCGTERLDD